MARTRKDVVDDAPPKARSDAYTGLLIVSLLAQIAGAVFLYLDYSQYPANMPKKAHNKPPAAVAPGNPAPVAPVAPVVPPPQEKEAPKAAP